MRANRTLCVFFLVLAFLTPALAWPPGTHAYIADKLKRGGDPVNVRFGAMTPDINQVLSTDQVSAYFFATHYSAIPGLTDQGFLDVWATGQVVNTPEARSLTRSTALIQARCQLGSPVCCQPSGSLGNRRTISAHLRAASSIFLHREFGVQVWAADLWFSPAENLERIRDAGAEAGVFPIRADARALPFATEFFDAVVSIDSFVYYGTDAQKRRWRCVGASVFLGTMRAPDARRVSPRIGYSPSKGRGAGTRTGDDVTA